MVHVGDVFKMRVIKIDREQRRLGLSIRAYVESTGEDPLISRAPQPAEPPEPEEESAASVEEAGEMKVEEAGEMKVEEAGDVEV